MNAPTDPADPTRSDTADPTRSDSADATPTDSAADGEVDAPRWQRHPRALWRRSSDRIIVLPPEQAAPLLLEGTGTLIWELLEHPMGVHELVDLLARATTADRDTIAPEVTSFLTRLATEHVVELQP